MGCCGGSSSICASGDSNNIISGAVSIYFRRKGDNRNGSTMSVFCIVE